MLSRCIDRRLFAWTLVLALAVTVPVHGQDRRPRSGPSTHSGKQGAGKLGTAADTPLANFAGVVTNSTSKRLSVRNEDGKVMEFECSKKTTYWSGKDKINASELKPGANVTVGAKIGIDGKAEAVEVHVEPAKAGALPPGF